MRIKEPEKYTTPKCGEVYKVNGYTGYFMLLDTLDINGEELLFAQLSNGHTFSFGEDVKCTPVDCELVVKG